MKPEESEITVFQTIANLSVDLITKDRLEWLCIPPKDSPLFQAVVILIFKVHPIDLDNKRAEFYTFPPVACSSSQFRMWLYAVEYFIKRRWGESNYKIAGVSRDTSEISERIGDVLSSCFRICEHLYEIGHYYVPCLHPMYIFLPLAQDIYNLHFFIKEGTKGKYGKREEISYYSMRFLEGKNRVDKELYPNFHAFIDVLIEQSLVDRTFRQKFIAKKSTKTSSEMGLATALSTVASQLFNRSNSLSVVTVTEKSLKFNMGSGKGCKTITQKQLKKLIL